MSTLQLDKATLQNISSINLAEVKQAVDGLASSHPDIRKVLLISPVVEDYLFFKKSFPQFELFITLIGDWNLNERCPLPLGHFDLAIASNVLMYARHPQRWIDHVLEVSDYFCVQDLIYRKRSAQPPFLGTDTDTIRYCNSRENIASPFPAAFDLSSIRQQMHHFKAYQGGNNEFHQGSDTPVHFVAIFESDCPRTSQSDLIHPATRIRFRLRNLAFSNLFINKIYRGLRKLMSAT